jgi:thiol-disulfide isomerase/thioredoxin
MKGLFIDLGASIPVLLMAWSGAAFTSKPHLVFFLSTSLVAAVAGVYARRLGRWAGLGVGIGSMVATLLVAGLLVPVVLERLSFRHLNRPAPAFSFKSPDGSRITNESLRGRVAVLTFWATWCPPCREELPRINALFARYRQAPDVAFLAVNTEAEAPIRNAENFLQKRGLSVPLVVAEDESARNLGAAALPTLVILDRAGNIRLIHVGYDGAENLDGVVSKQINALLRPER